MCFFYVGVDWLDVISGRGNDVGANVCEIEPPLLLSVPHELLD